MKINFKSFISGLVVGCLLIGVAPSMASTILFNKAKVQVNNNTVKANTITYNKNVYVLAKDIGNIFNKNVSINSNVSFTDKEGKTDKKIDNCVIYTKNGQDYVEFNEVLRLVDKDKDILSYKPIFYDEDIIPNEDFDINLFQLFIDAPAREYDGQLLYKRFDCSYIWLSDNKNYVKCVSIEDYKKYLQPMLKMTIEQIRSVDVY